MLFSRRNSEQAGPRFDRDPVELGLMGLGVVVLIGLLAAKSMLLSDAEPENPVPQARQSYQPGDEQMPTMSQGQPERDVGSDRETTEDEKDLPSSSVRAFAMRTPAVVPPLAEFELSSSCAQDLPSIVQVDGRYCTGDVLSRKLQSTVRFVLLGAAAE